MFKKKNDVSFVDSLVLIVFIGMVLFIPLLLLQVFGKSWDLVTWHNSSDLSMLEWSSAFIHVFLFLLLFEQFYTGRRLYFILIACAFLNMGLTNFAYALVPIGSECSLWLRFYSFLIGGLFVVLAIFFRKSLHSNVNAVVFKVVVPSVLLTSAVLFFLTYFKQLLPPFFLDHGHVSISGKVVFLLPSMLFFSAAIFWLHEYIKEKKRLDFLFTVVFLVYAQILLLFRESQSWGIIWWLLHILLLINVLVACIYMLVLCVYRSLVWKLIFSLGLAFSLTVMIASAIIQRYYEKEYIRNYSRQLHEKHKNELMQAVSASYSIVPAMDIMQTIIDDYHSGGRAGADKDKFSDYLLKELNNHRNSLTSSFLQFGFFPFRGSPAYVTRRHFLISNMLNIELHAFLLKYLNISDKKPDELWTPFYYDANLNSWVVTYLKLFKNKDSSSPAGYAFCTFDVSKIRAPDIIKTNDITHLGGAIVFDRKHEQLLYAALPRDYGFKNKLSHGFLSLKTEKEIMDFLIPVIDLDNSGISAFYYFKGRRYFISANLAEPLDWVVLDIIDLDNFPDQALRSRYFFIAVAMITMLIGFTVLMILLRYLLSVPLRKILFATKELENENFDVTIDINDKTEFGVIANAFNHMVRKLKVLYSHLSTIVTEKSKALEEVERTNNAKISFFQNVSHELRTPMHGIISFARLGMNLSVADNEDKVKKYFSNINKSAERLMNMINSILDLAKFESGHMKLNFTCSSMKNLFAQIIEEFNAYMIEKNVDIVLEAEEQTMAEMDMEMIGHVIRNIVGNALKMSPSGSEIKINIKSQKNQIVVSVCDKGPGIPEQEIDNIFDKFVQVGEGEKHGGTGLGLALSREIIAAHGGVVYAENNRDGGACFIFKIPVSQVKIDKTGADDE